MTRNVDFVARTRHRVSLACDLITRHLDKRSAAHPEALRASRIPAMAALLADAAWWMPAEHLGVIADLGFAIYAFDDLADENEVSISDLELRADQLVACAAFEPCLELAFDPTARLLSDVAAGLARAPLAGALWSDWVETVGETFRGMVGHRRLAAHIDAGGNVDISDYLVIGRESVGVACVAVAAAILSGDAGMVDGRAQLRSAARHAATAVRIANDLRSAPREAAEGMRSALQLPDIDEAYLRARMVAERSRAGHFLAALPERGGAVGTFLERFADGMLAIYQACEFHDGSAALPPSLQLQVMV